MRAPRLALLALALATAAGCRGEGEGAPVRFTVPQGSGLSAIADTLAERDLVASRSLFVLYARMRGDDRALKPGVYEVPEGTRMGTLLDKLVAGDVIRMRVVVPEGWELRRIAPRLAQALELDADSVLAMMLDTASAERFDVPGPNLEGYLYPATYEFPVGTPLERILRTMVARYRAAWTDEMRARADSLGMTEREVVTLASIVEKEARVWEERPTIAAVFHNRLRINMPLQADPTVQYALGEPQPRLLYAHIDAVADHPYSTYGRRGLPPGPIASPSRGALEATLDPADVDFLYFVARPGGRHIFTRTLAEHNRARGVARREFDALEAERAARP